MSDDDAIPDEVPGWVYGMLDERLVVRMLLEIDTPDTDVALHLTDVVTRGFVKPAPNLSAKARRDLASLMVPTSPL